MDRLAGGQMHDTVLGIIVDDQILDIENRFTHTIAIIGRNLKEIRGGWSGGLVGRVRRADPPYDKERASTTFSATK